MLHEAYDNLLVIQQEGWLNVERENHQVTSPFERARSPLTMALPASKLTPRTPIVFGHATKLICKTMLIYLGWRRRADIQPQGHTPSIRRHSPSFSIVDLFCGISLFGVSIERQ
ncbi:hypothetical protein DMENIID0001_051430 [Sergentomyia squamirostris]